MPPPSRFALAYHAVERWRSRGVSNLEGMPPQIGKTFHVGEDFRDLLTGVRQVDLALDLLRMRAGDRLGHALAVGLDPDRWYRRRGRSFPRCGDHLLDLLWAQSRLPELDGGHELIDAANVRLKALCKGAKVPLESLEQQFSAWLEQLGGEQPGLAVSERELQERLLGGSRSELTEVQPDERWLEMLCCLQRAVVRRIDRKGLFIEANPTSNLQIAGLTEFTQLPLFRLHPVRSAAGRGGPEARLSVSTDDPETFRVNLREEYAALFQAAERQSETTRETPEYSRREILDWLDRLRCDSFESSFLRQSSPSAYDLLRYLRLLTGKG